MLGKFATLIVRTIKVKVVIRDDLLIFFFFLNYLKDLFQT